jgi:hypothetical protein
MATDAARERATEVMGVLVERMERYDQLLDDLRNGRIDGRDFRRQAVITGIVQQIDGVWIFDLANMRWVYYDGVELSPVPSDPAAPAAGPAATAKSPARSRTRTPRS